MFSVIVLITCSVGVLELISAAVSPDGPCRLPAFELPEVDGPEKSTIVPAQGIPELIIPPLADGESVPALSERFFDMGDRAETEKLVRKKYLELLERKDERLTLPEDLVSSNWRKLKAKECTR